MLKGQYKMAWKQVIHDKFPERVNPTMVPLKQDRSQGKNFCHVVERFLKKALHEDREALGQAIHLLHARQQLQCPKGIDDKAH